ncbi:MAG: hypothetical protein WAW16_09050 [Candidatus Cryosericum sp.]
MAAQRCLLLSPVGERDGILTSFVFRGEIKQVEQVLKKWSRSRYGSQHTYDVTYFTIMSADQMIATVVRDNASRRWYLLRVMD